MLYAPEAEVNPCTQAPGVDENLFFHLQTYESRFHSTLQEATESLDMRRVREVYLHGWRTSLSGGRAAPGTEGRFEDTTKEAMDVPADPPSLCQPRSSAPLSSML
jgi:hypothetical protein